MKKRLLQFMLPALMLLGSSVANAQFNWERFYISASGAVSFHETYHRTFDLYLKTDTGPRYAPERIDFHPGGTGLLSVGYMDGPTRVELEGGFRHYSIERYQCGVRTNSFIYNDSGADSYARIGSVMINMYRDIPLQYGLTGYVGGGMGLGFYTLDLDDVSFADLSGISSSMVMGNKKQSTNFAWQFMAGVSYAVTECVDLTMGYRMFTIAKPTSSGVTVVDRLVVNTPATGKIGWDHRLLSHEAEFGVRIKL